MTINYHTIVKSLTFVKIGGSRRHLHDVIFQTRHEAGAQVVDCSIGTLVGMGTGQIYGQHFLQISLQEK